MEIVLLLIIGLLLYILWPNTASTVQPEPQEEKETPSSEEPKLTEDYLTLENYVGQTDNINYIKGHINQAQLDNNPLPHIVLWGSGGLGKSTLMKAVAHEIKGRFIEIIPANLRNVNDLFSILFQKICIHCEGLNHFSVNKCIHCKEPIKISFYPYILLQDKDILFLEECHGLKPEIEEAMYSLMQDGYIMLRYCGMDRRVELPKITVAGATTKIGDLNKPFRDRFKISVFLRQYSEDELCDIIKTFCEHKNIGIDQVATKLIAKIAVGVPRIAKKYVLDARTRGNNITEKEVKEILTLLKVDENGLEETHRKILEYIYIRTNEKNYGAGQAAIASSVGLSQSIYLEVYEPTLLYKGYIFFGNRGRIITELGKKTYFEKST